MHLDQPSLPATRLATALFVVASLLSTGASARIRPLEPPEPSDDDGQHLIDVVVKGPDADDDKGLECREVFARWGIQAIETAPLRVTLYLRDGGNRLTISSDAGVLYEQGKPDWHMSDLCRDALAHALEVEAQTVRPKETVRTPPPTSHSPAPNSRVPAPLAPRRTAASSTPLTPTQEKARAHHVEALKHFDLGEFEEAAVEWSKSYGINPRPEFLANIGHSWFRRGQIEGQVRDLRKARHFYSRYADAAPGPTATEQLHQVDDAIKALGAR